jgi:hypothetical protein
MCRRESGSPARRRRAFIRVPHGRHQAARGIARVVSDPAFWDKGLGVIARFIGEIEKLG